jgi:hypothetical protein
VAKTRIFSRVQPCTLNFNIYVFSTLNSILSCKDGFRFRMLRQNSENSCTCISILTALLIFWILVVLGFKIANDNHTSVNSVLPHSCVVEVAKENRTYQDTLTKIESMDSSTVIIGYKNESLESNFKSSMNWYVEVLY